MVNGAPAASAPAEAGTAVAFSVAKPAVTVTLAADTVSRVFNPASLIGGKKSSMYWAIVLKLS